MRYALAAAVFLLLGPANAVAMGYVAVVDYTVAVPGDGETAETLLTLRTFAYAKADDEAIPLGPETFEIAGTGETLRIDMPEQVLRLAAPAAAECSPVEAAVEGNNPPVVRSAGSFTPDTATLAGVEVRICARPAGILQYEFDASGPGWAWTASGQWLVIPDGDKLLWIHRRTQSATYGSLVEATDTGLVRLEGARLEPAVSSGDTRQYQVELDGDALRDMPRHTFYFAPMSPSANAAPNQDIPNVGGAALRQFREKFATSGGGMLIPATGDGRPLSWAAPLPSGTMRLAWLFWDQ